MTSLRDNQILTRTGPGTALGNLMRRYWIPAAKSSELIADGDPLRLMIMGEKLIAFRDSTGKVGIMDHRCPHRCASLFFGRNEEGGIRCVYHGWKFDTEGNCLDMANVPPHQDFKQKVKARAYKTAERNGLVWVFMGNQEEVPGLPEIEAALVPTDEIDITFIQRKCNWLQALEGDIDTSHLGFLHFGAVKAETVSDNEPQRHAIQNRAPEFKVRDVDWGVMCGAYRPTEEPDMVSWRFAHFLMPFWSIPPIGASYRNTIARAWVPMDDETVMFVGLVRRGHGAQPEREGNFGQIGSTGQNEYLPNTTDWYGRWRTASNAENDYRIDRDRQRSESYTGIDGIHIQDLAITESMGGIVDRSQENPVPSDAMIYDTRRFLRNSAAEYVKSGKLPLSATTPSVYAGVRGGHFTFRADADWLDAYAEQFDVPPLAAE